MALLMNNSGMTPTLNLSSHEMQPIDLSVGKSAPPSRPSLPVVPPHIINITPGNQTTPRQPPASSTHSSSSPVPAMIQPRKGHGPQLASLWNSLRKDVSFHEMAPRLAGKTQVETLTLRHTLLIYELSTRLQTSPQDPQLCHLVHCYLTMVERIESRRHKSLACLSQGQSPEVVNTHYDTDRLKLFSGISSSLHRHSNQQPSPSHPDNAWSTSAGSPSPTDSGYLSPRSPETSATPAPTATRGAVPSPAWVATPSGQLSQTCVEMMEAWFQDNLDNPYPNTKTVAKLAHLGGATTTQVRRWIATRRLKANKIRSRAPGQRSRSVKTPY